MHSAVFLVGASAFVLIGCGSGEPPGAALDAAARDSAAADVVEAGDAASGDAPADAMPPLVSCDAYCTAVMANCTGADQQYDSMQTCVAACQHFDVGSYDDDGGTVGCRQAHAVAAAGNPGKECAIAGEFGGDTCDTRCNAYCALVMRTCTGSDIVYPDRSSCDYSCGGVFAFDPKQSEYTQSGNTLNCREYYAHRTEGQPDAAADDCTAILDPPNATRCK